MGFPMRDDRVGHAFALPKHASRRSGKSRKRGASAAAASDGAKKGGGGGGGGGSLRSEVLVAGVVRGAQPFGVFVGLAGGLSALVPKPKLGLAPSLLASSSSSSSSSGGDLASLGGGWMRRETPQTSVAVGSSVCFLTCALHLSEEPSPP